jgi:hypothetical protein
VKRGMPYLGNRDEGLAVESWDRIVEHVVGPGFIFALLALFAVVDSTA